MRSVRCRLNEESLAIACLYQHASTARRRQLYEVLWVNDCECLDCQLKTRSLAAILRDVPLPRGRRRRRQAPPRA